MTNIAILDDDRSVRTALGRLLQATGLDVTTYATGNEFLDSLTLKHPDCLILDFQMPRMTGLEVLKHLNLRQIRIATIVITAHDEIGAIEACLKAGASAWFRKPLDGDQVIQTIANISGKSPNPVTACRAP